MVSIRKLEAELWEAADKLRSNSKLTSNQYCMPVLGLIFLRYAYSRFKLVEKELMKNRPVRNGRVMPIEKVDFVAKSAIYLPLEAQYDFIKNLPANISEAGLKNRDGEPINSLGEAVNNAMVLIEDESSQLKGILPKTYTDFKDDLLAELIRIFDKSVGSVDGDIIGRIYEYFLNKFAKSIASDDGAFFTPKSLVKMIVNVIEPTKGVLLDPACGSGGMFVQSGDFVNSHGMQANMRLTFYGQEKTEYNAQLCLMNMAVHGLSGKVISGDSGNTFYNDNFNLEGKCDYVMANPPFNVDSIMAEQCLSAGRLPFGLPSVNKKKEISNGNYVWISYFYSYLNEKGRAGFVMASSATDSQSGDKLIRKSLIETNAIDIIISVGNNFFYTKSLPCTLWFLDKSKKEEIRDKVLFIDARNYFTVVDRTLNEWTKWQINNLNAIVYLYRGELEKYTAVLEEYYSFLGSRAPFKEQEQAIIESLNAMKEEAKERVASAKQREKKIIQNEYDEKLALIEEKLTVAKEASWLYEKFAEGKYSDILGLCKIATIEEIEEKGYSLTPGAYVGVASQDDDGVNFKERMVEIHSELLALQEESNSLMATISKNMKEMGL